MHYLPKLNQLISDVDLIEDFVKVSFADNKISEQAATELIRLIKEAKDKALNNR